MTTGNGNGNGNGRGHPRGTRGPLVRLELGRRKLDEKDGLAPLVFEHFRRPPERPFTESQRAHTTVLLGGLSPRHDKLVEAALQGLGYRCTALPPVTIESYATGRHFGNNGLCNPTYFTVGNLVRHLEQLEASGLSRREIVDGYVFVTAGSCGTCRFGMYEAEYRLALANAGFEGFRVLTFGTNAGIDQSTGEPAGLDMNLDFFLALITAFDVGDVLNQYLYRMRSYEVERGSTQRAMARVIDDFRHVIRELKWYEPADHWTRVFAGTPIETPLRYTTKILSLTTSDQVTDAMRNARRTLDEVELDPFRVRPVVKLTGEFWAQTTEGPGNFDMHAFLEDEGAEVSVDRPLFTRLSWELHQAKLKARDRKGLRNGESRLSHYVRYYRKLGVLSLAERMLRRENERLLEALGGSPHAMVPHRVLERIARPYWNWRTTSGESHLEIAENVYYHTHGLAHMVLSVKPFGCMPSTQSDAVQARVVEDHPGMIFLPIETSGDGEVMAHSRVQMALGPAKAKARIEMEAVLSDVPWRLEDLKAYVDDNPQIKRASYKVPHRKGVVGRAANLAYHVSELLSARTVSVPSAEWSGS